MTYSKLYNQKNGGAAMMILVFFFVFVSLALLIGIVTPVVREFRIASSNLASKQAYYTSESGVEDAMYRINNSKQIGTTSTLTLGASTATTTITNEPSGQKDLTTIGTADSHQRKVDLLMSTGTAVSLTHAVQIGQGGMDISGSSVITGDVYANGPISGDSSSSITGNAVSADSLALSANQGNGTGVPPYNISFGNSASTKEIAQSFQVTTTSPINTIQIYIKKVGSPTNRTMKIVNDAAGLPGSTVIASGIVYASSVNSSYGWVDIVFTTNPSLTVGTTYWVIVDAGFTSGNYYVIGATSGGYANGTSKIGDTTTGWNNTTPPGLDFFFNVYLGGVYGSIAGDSGSSSNPLHIGTVAGTASAHTVKYTSSSGLIYCQSGVGNNKTCTNSVAQYYASFPISDADITQWKADATAGGVTNGNVTVGSAGATLGPRKIVGNLTVSNGGTLTITGGLWVTGNITVNGGATVVLAPTLSTNDGIVMTDGIITISNGAHATGSGSSGSYIMLLTTSGSASAVSISGGAGSAIIYAPNGFVTVSGGAALKQVTAYGMVLGGGSSVTYDPALSSSNFITHSSSTWNISNWQEIQ